MGVIDPDQGQRSAFEIRLARASGRQVDIVSLDLATAASFRPPRLPQLSTSASAVLGFDEWRHRFEARIQLTYGALVCSAARHGPAWFDSWIKQYRPHENSLNTGIHTTACVSCRWQRRTSAWLGPADPMCRSARKGYVLVDRTRVP